jgi:ribosomal protein S18 acetylase RimI-like enzyme
MRGVIEQTWGWDEAWQQADFAERFAACTVSIIEVKGRAAGAVWLEPGPGSIHITELQVTPELQGNGIGTATIRNVIEEAAGRGLPVTLSVVPVNLRARRLYERLGFRVTAVEAPFIHMRRDPQTDSTRDSRPDSHAIVRLKPDATDG